MLKSLKILFACGAAAILLSFTACKKPDVTNVSRVYFTYEIGHHQLSTRSDGTQFNECVQGDGMCAFEVQQPAWRPSRALPDGQGFGYLTVTPRLKLQMVIYMPFLSLGTYQQHYADGVAQIPGPWKVAARLVTGLGLSDGYTVSMGNYSIGTGVEDGYEVLIITF